MQTTTMLRALSAVVFFATALTAPLVIADRNKPENKPRLAADTVQGDLSVMVLGSGGPIATSSGRASAG